MMFGGWFSGGGSMAGMSGMIVNGGLAYADRWPPMVLPLGLYRAAEEDDIPEKWRNLERHARKRRTRKKWQNKIRRRIKKQQKGGRQHGRNDNN